MMDVKKRLLTMAVLCLLLLCGCGGTATPTSGAESARTDAGNRLTLTQTPSVSGEKYAGKAEFASFLSRAEKKFLIPGLNQAAIPQGMSYCETTGLVYISAYYKVEAVPSVIMALDAQSGEFVAPSLSIIPICSQTTSLRRRIFRIVKSGYTVPFPAQCVFRYAAAFPSACAASWFGKLRKSTSSS